MRVLMFLNMTYWFTDNVSYVLVALNDSLAANQLVLE